ncbi:hypothetical protein [Streptomyces sp. NPDC048002]|uniref:hypothetical protein n=1 Tax=unclassified Streptomyces TaxID=2593676 RepID=UPI0033DE6698
MNPNSLFSAPDEQPLRSPAVAPPPATDPFRAPDFDEEDIPSAEPGAAPRATTG